jgi:hypothetical protein
MVLLGQLLGKISGVCPVLAGLGDSGLGVSGEQSGHHPSCSEQREEASVWVQDTAFLHHGDQE